MTVFMFMLPYMGVIQSAIENQYRVQYMKKSGEKIFTLKKGDCDVVSKNNIASTTIRYVTFNGLLKLGAY